MQTWWLKILFTALCITAKCSEKERCIHAEPIVHNIFTFDHFIELVEKIEQHPKTSPGLDMTVNYIRTLAYDDQLWNILLGQSKSLPNDVLSLEEERVLRDMIQHRYIGPIEAGVVRMPNNDTIAMGHVITGICAGMRRNKRLSLASWDSNAEDPVDNLFVATLVGTLARAGMEHKNEPSKALYGLGGHWKPNNTCPQIYFNTAGPSASDAQILGDIDGFILGYSISTWSKKGVRLGQLLRMYYSSGIFYDTSYVYCNRASKINQLIPAYKRSLFGQVVVFSFPFYNKNKARYQNVKNSDIIPIAIKTVMSKTEGFYSYIDKLLSGVSCKHNEGSKSGCELPANLVFIMDESGSIWPKNYEIEKSFVNKIIGAFDISPHQTRVAVVEYSDATHLAINLNDYGSKTRLQCAVKKFHYRGGATHTAKAINMVNDQILRPAQDNFVGSKIPQIVILLTDGKTNDPNTTALGQAVRRIKREIKDLTILTVGIGDKFDINELKLIATDPTKHVFKASDFNDLIKLVTSLQNYTCTTPVTIDIDFHQDANETVISAFVSPKRPRFFVVPSESLIGLKNLYIEITPIYGTVAVYVSRVTSTPGPSDYAYKIDPLDVGEKMSFYLPDPCQGYNVTTCADLYLAIYGDASTLTCSEQSCTLPNQIKFTIRKGSKINARSSSSQRNVASLLTFTSCIVFFFLLHKQHDKGRQTYRV